MKLNKTATQQKTYPKQEVIQYKKGTPVDWKLYRIDYTAKLPYGKYRGKTLGWVHDNEHHYYMWICNQELLMDWNLVELKVQPKQNKIQYIPENSLLTEDGELWVCIIEQEGYCENKYMD